MNKCLALPANRVLSGTHQAWLYIFLHPQIWYCIPHISHSLILTVYTMSCLYFFVMHAPPSHMTIAIVPEDICTVLLILVTFRCLCCSFCACCAFTTMAMITWPLYLKMLALFFSELDEFLSACCRSWDESLNLMTWCGIQSLPLRWKLTTEEIVPPRLPAVSSVATGFGRSSFNIFSFNITRTVFWFCVPINSTTTSEAPGSVLSDLGMVS